MRILGIETSCDETAVCLIEATGDFEGDFKFDVLGNALYSQAKLHEQYGGVFPNLAKREHAKNLVPLLEQALQQAEALVPLQQGGSLLKNSGKAELEILLDREPELFEQLVAFFEKYKKPTVDCIAVTHGPGLEPCLWVGVNFAKALSLVWNIPIVAINHMEGHIILSLMDVSDLVGHSSGKQMAFEFPMLSLLISGGHTELVVSREFMRYEVVGQTRDDAAGEAFDKVARLLGLPYPGGPEISKLAQQLREQGLPSLSKDSPWKLPRPMLHEENLDFSFAGLKTAVRKLVEQKSERGSTSLTDKSQQGVTLPLEARKQIAMEFENAVADVLVEKTMRAIDQFGANTIVVGGGVSANTYIREQLAQALEAEGNPAKLLVPLPELATDNALMIALAGYFHAIKKDFIGPEKLVANGNLKLC